METIKNECPHGCHRYRQSIEEIVEAGNKHKEQIVILRKLAEDQKKKISILREEKNSLLDSTDCLEVDAKRHTELSLKLSKENRELKIGIRDLRKELIEKDELLDEQIQKSVDAEVLKAKLKDLADELLKKKEENKILKEVNEKKQNDFVTNNVSLENELLNSTSKIYEELKEKMKKLEHKLERVAEKELFEERIKLFKKMEIISELRKSNLK